MIKIFVVAAPHPSGHLQYDSVDAIESNPSGLGDGPQALDEFFVSETRMKLYRAIGARIVVNEVIGQYGVRPMSFPVPGGPARTT